MAKPEWGAKRICTNCHARFYDLQKNPIECPSCGTTFDPDVFAKPKRARSAAASDAARKAAAEAERRKKAAAEAEAEVSDDELDKDIDEDIDEDIEDEDENGVLEDASDLGEDDDDVAEVLENVDEERKED